MGIFGAVPLILRGSHSGEFLEFMNEVSLVVVAAIRRQVGPVRCWDAVRGGQRLAEAENPRRQLGSESHAAIEARNHLLMADAEARGKLAQRYYRPRVERRQRG